MKRYIKKIVLLIVAILGVNCANAQMDFSIHLGMALPQGDFAKGDKEKLDFAWGTPTTHAAAGLGFDAGVKLRFNLPFVKGLGVITTADFILNTPNNAAKEWRDEFIAFNEEAFSVKCSMIIPNYINIPIMVGLNYQYGINNNIKLWGEGALGLNIGTLTNQEYSNVFLNFDSEVRVDVTYETNYTLGFQLGAGVMLKDRYSLGVHYYSLGSQQIQLLSVTKSIDDGESGIISEENYTYGKINPQMLTIRLGYHF